MPVNVLRDDVVRMVDEGAQLIEALPRTEYERIHLPHAISLPLAELEREAASKLDRDRALILYCWDYQ